MPPKPIPAILGEPNNNATGFVGSDTGGGAYVGYRNPRRKKDQGASGRSTDSTPVTPPIVDGPARTLGVPRGAIPKTSAPASVNNTRLSTPDLRVKIRVPADYLTELTSGWDKELSKLGGIIFPYTPTISTEWKADYTSQSPTHSNYSIHFYKNSYVTDIQISGKFTVQNDQDAVIYLSTLHLLRGLTKMRWGGPLGDADQGAPPPVCRLDAYGAFQYKNVPVAITSFKNDLPNDVDFYAYDRKGNGEWFGPAFCPASSTIAVTLRPMYSRREMQEIGVAKYLDDSSWKSKGYL